MLPAVNRSEFRKHLENLKKRKGRGIAQDKKRNEFKRGKQVLNRARKSGTQ